MRAQAAVLAAGVVLVLASTTGCAGSDTPTPSGTAASSVTASTSSSVPSSASATPSTTATSSAGPASLPVYYIAESQRSFKLYREFRRVPDKGGAVASAVSAMTALAPLDPDYLTPWRPASRIAVSQRGTNLAIDLSADAFSNTNVGSGLAAAAIQQLVYTATAAAAQTGSPASTVTITKDGRPADVWGVLRIGEATARAALLDVQAQAWVTAPQEGEVRKAGSVSFAGYGTSFEATFSWVVSTSEGKTVARGSAMGGTGTGGFGPFTFSTRLEPGTYTVTVATDDPSGRAEGNGPASDDKMFTVR
jgi:hypothetical protein